MDAPTARAALEWLVEAGADEALAEAPIDRFALPDKAEWQEAAQARRAAEKPFKAPAKAAPKPARADGPVDPAEAVDAAEAAAAAAGTLDALKAAIGAYPHCDLKKSARNVVFSDGLAGAHLMVIGEAPGRDEDIEGKPFVGRSGKLLDKMAAAIGLSRRAEDPAEGLYITNVMPWRPPGNRDPEALEIAMMRPFLLRHIELAKPKAIAVMGNPACAALLGKRGITKLRGNWETVGDVPAMPTFHPAYLLRNPIKKRESWADLLAIEDRLRG